MRRSFTNFACDREKVGGYIRASNDKDCLLKALAAICDGYVTLKSLNDSKHPDMYYYEDCGHYFLIIIRCYYSVWDSSDKYDALVEKIKPVSGGLSP